ncbi:GntR family transcriptional regulator [Lactobacillus xylocopicola]|uniref:Phosphonate metabolism transcriptional regulator PhnF n=1 Tax=Lactobacillus xylocopicola TaxID=2976676 RepID=A0ABM8BFT6_9LACO|nr:GntR family transcriptional regulator [Lactobacillus xylocopicola]BDR60122.1 phosphonate metabolism transcriptional regulator PhnF [Lactobacillus xylocopicola]
MEYKERSAAIQAQEYLEQLIKFNRKSKVLPSQREVAEQLNISRNAVMHALEWLKSEDQVAVKERTGIAANSKIDINMLGMESMTAELKTKSVTIRHLSTELISPTPGLRKFFGAEVEQLIKISRVRLTAGVPLTYEIAYFDQSRFAKLATTDFTDRPLYEFLNQQYGIKPAYGQETITCVLADQRTSEILTVQEGTPLYQVQSCNYQSDDTPLETTDQYLTGSRFKYHFKANNIYDYRED